MGISVSFERTWLIGPPTASNAAEYVLHTWIRVMMPSSRIRTTRDAALTPNIMLDLDKFSEAEVQASPSHFTDTSSFLGCKEGTGKAIGRLFSSGTVRWDISGPSAPIRGQW